MRNLQTVVIAAVLLAGMSPFLEAQDWPTFGWNIDRTSAPNVGMGLSAERIGSLARQQVALDGTVDGSAIYLRGGDHRRVPS